MTEFPPFNRSPFAFRFQFLRQVYKNRGSKMTEIPDSPFLASQVAFSRSKSIEPRIKISITRRKKKKKN
jgi:hypothetical protein